jgi:hypothetical protein
VVGLAPVLHQPAGEDRHCGAEFLGQCGYLGQRCCELDHLAGHVELRLSRRGVADADRAGAPVAGQLRHLGLGWREGSINTDERQRSVLGDNVADKRCERSRCLDEPEPQHGEGCQ